MSKIRINELARQLEVKSREVIDKLHELGIAEKVTHSSSIDEDKADQLRRYYRGESYAPKAITHPNGAGTAVEERNVGALAEPAAETAKESAPSTQRAERRTRPPQPDPPALAESPAAAGAKAEPARESARLSQEEKPQEEKAPEEKTEEDNKP